MAEIVSEETTWGGDTKYVYDDGSVGIEKTNMWGDKEITISKDNEEIAHVLSHENASGTESQRITYNDGSSGSTIHDPNALFGPENITYRDGKSTGESYYDSVINHEKEALANNLDDDGSYCDDYTSNHNENEKNNSNEQQDNYSDEHTYNDTDDSDENYRSIPMQRNISRQQIIQQELYKVSQLDCKYELASIVYKKKQYPEVQLAAIERLKSITGKGLESSAIVFLSKKHDSQVRYEIFKDTKNIPLSGERLGCDCDNLARHDPDKRIRLEAMKRLPIDEYQHTFSFIASEENDLEIQLEAIKRIKKSSATEYREKTYGIYSDLERIVEGNTNSNIENRKEALKKITNEEFCYKIAKNGNNESLSLLAIDQITEKEYLERLKSSSKYISVRKKAKKILYPPNKDFEHGLVAYFVRNILKINI